MKLLAGSCCQTISVSVMQMYFLHQIAEGLEFVGLHCITEKNGILSLYNGRKMCDSHNQKQEKH